MLKGVRENVWGFAFDLIADCEPVEVTSKRIFIMLRDRAVAFSCGRGGEGGG